MNKSRVGIITVADLVAGTSVLENGFRVLSKDQEG